MLHSMFKILNTEIPHENIVLILEQLIMWLKKEVSILELGKRVPNFWTAQAPELP